MGEIGKIFERVKRGLSDTITSDKTPAAKQADFAGRMLYAVTKVRDLCRTKFRQVAGESHQRTTRNLIDEIPLSWLMSRLPIETRLAMEERTIISPPYRPHLLLMEIGQLSLVPVVEDDTYPLNVPTGLVSKVKLTDEQKEELLAKVLFPPPSAKEVARIVSRGDWEGRLESLSTRISDKRIAFSELVQGYSEGENITQIRQRLEPLVAGHRASAQRIARTEAGRIAEQTQRRNWNELGDMMTGAQIVAVLDQRTRSHHAHRNGAIYYRNPKSGQLPLADVPDLPDEPNCRCITSIVMQPPEELANDPNTMKAFASMDGGGIVDPNSYEQWFSQARHRERELAVGKTKYAEVKTQLREIRQPEWSDFIDEDGKPLTLAELKNETATQRQARKQRVKKEIERRANALREVRTRGFEFPKRPPTQVAGQTFSGMVDPSDPVSMLGEAVRQRVAKGVKGEKQIREVGKLIRDNIETPELITEIRKGHEIRAEIQRLWLEKKKKGLSADKLQRLIDSKKEFATHFDKLNELKQRRFIEVMSSVRDFGSNKNQPVTANSNVDVERFYNETQKFFPKDWIDRFQATRLTVGPTSGSSHYLHSQRRLMLNTTADYASGLGGSQIAKSTMVHEMFHQAEDIVPGVYDAEKELYKRRTKKSQLRPLSWHQSVKIRRDKWLGSKGNGQDEYMGREYPDGYEIGTMGMQGVVFGDVSIENDPEVYDLLLGMLASL